MKVRVPKVTKGEKSVIDYSRYQDDHSKLQVVAQYPHNGEVNKARAHPNNGKLIASLLNCGQIKLYEFNKDKSEI